jgi:hypothetical protein
MTMEDDARRAAAQRALPVILMAAVVQGGALYALHLAIKGHHWPATDQAWLIALYSVVVFVPMTVQLLAEYARAAPLWRLVAILAAAYFYFGWHHGAAVSALRTDPLIGTEQFFPLGLLLTVLWLLALPFAQSRLAYGDWTIRYAALFTNGWRNKLVLAEAALFTGLFWLLLLLWQTLFHMLGLNFFRELFEEPLFVYPVTSLAFGCALHLIGSLERLTSVVLEQLLNVLKWLGLLAGVILACFTVALALKLPGLLFTGQKAIGAAWLLWLTAVVVLLLNAAYRDGSVSQAYPRWMAQFMRVVVPFTVVVSSTALYAVLLRSRHYGLTVERVWAFVVGGAALLYSVGYAISAFGKGPWFGGIARVNVSVAIALMAVICAALTPLLSPYRLAAYSQYRLVLDRGAQAPEGKDAAQPGPGTNTAMHYLRFDSGMYGEEKLKLLAQLDSGADAENTRRAAKILLSQKLRWERPSATDFHDALASLRVFPAGRVLDADLVNKLNADLGTMGVSFAFQGFEKRTVGVFIDLNGDKSDEFVLLTPYRGLVYEKQSDHWAQAAIVLPMSSSQPELDFNRAIIDELAKGNVSAVTPKWNELSIGGHVLRVNPVQEPAKVKSTQ